MSKNVSIEFKEVPRFKAGSEEALEYLDEEGFVVFANVLDSIQTGKALSLMWDYLEELGTGIDRNNKETWFEPKCRKSHCVGFWEGMGCRPHSQPPRSGIQKCSNFFLK